MVSMATNISHEAIRHGAEHTSLYLRQTRIT